MAEGIPYVCPDCLAELGPPSAADAESCPACGFVRPPSGWLADPLTGLILAQRYRLEGRLGAGGMASVFRASRVGALGGKVAVKVLAPRLSRTVVARRFEREAQVVSHLASPHIVRIYDFDTFTFPGSAQPLYFIAMELVDGTTLAQLLRKQGAVNFMWAIDVLRQAARGLDEAHAVGIVHRDLKPSNIMLLQQREATHVKLVDFGIAGLAEVAGEPVEKLTQTGFVSGTPDYMAPEQCIGNHPVGPPADVYALGIVAYEMFTGERPFIGDSVIDVLMQRVTRPAPSLRDACRDRELPSELYRIVDKMLAREPRDRYAHAGELLDDLARFPTQLTRPDLSAATAEAIAATDVVALRSRPVLVPGPPGAQSAATAVEAEALRPHAQSAPTALATPAPKPGTRPVFADTASVDARPIVAVATPAHPDASARPDESGPLAALPAPPPSTGADRAPRRRARWPFAVAGLALVGGATAAAVLATGGSPPAETAPGLSDPRSSAVTAPPAHDPRAATAPPARDPRAATAPAPSPDAADAAPVEPPAAATTAPGPSPPALADAVAPPTPATPDNALTGPRPPLPGDLRATALPIGPRLATLAVPAELPPLYHGTPLLLALDEGGAPLRLASGSLEVHLAPSGERVGRAEGQPRPADGRLAFTLPPLPVAAPYRLSFALTLPDGTERALTLVYDATNGRVTASP